ncbi:MAG TPA: hypothetical protein VGC91_03155 [Pyrinomonadaceae bacterium]|jgi:hypothetical protein
MPKKPQTCFVIMPFGEKPNIDGQIVDFDVVYQYIIRPVTQRVGLEVVRSDEIQSPGLIHADMIEHIMSDDVAIVDITSLNPNVFYELGVRHALRKSLTIMIRKKGTKNPFNIQGMRTIEYDTDIESATKAQNEIEQFIRNGLIRQSNDSMVYQVLPDLRVSRNE